MKANSPHFNQARGTLAERIRTLRSKRGYSQEHLADKAECHRTYIGMIERKISNPSLKLLVALADALDVGVDELLKR